MKNNCFLILSPSDWGQVVVSNMQYALRFSRSPENTVYYFESIATRAPKLDDLPRILKRILKSIIHARPAHTQLIDPEALQLQSPFVIPWHENFIARKINKIMLLRYIEKIISKHKNDQLYIIIYNPYWIDIVKEISTPHKLLFHCVDNLSTYSSSPIYMKRYNQLKKHAHKIIVPNEILKSEFLKQNSKTYVIPHGCSHEANPTRLLNNYQVVYSGNLADWMDYDLLEVIVKSCPKFHFHFVGSVTAKLNIKRVNALFEKDNVTYYGKVSYDELAKIYANCSIGIVPYDPNNIHIKFSTPTKFLDYIFSGLRVLSTDFPNARAFGKLVEIANSPSEFIKLIQLEIEPNDDYNAKRKELIMQSSWDQRFKQFKSILYED